MNTKFLSIISSRKMLQHATLALGCVASAFVIGIQSAGEVQPISLIEAGSMAIRGDFNGSGDIDLQDVHIVLEVVAEYRVPTAEQLLNDPDGDGQLTVDDALRLISILSLR